MIKNLLLIISIIFIVNCNLNRVEKNHGVHNLENKQLKLIINISNKNDILRLLGSPSIKSDFDENIIFYIERKTSTNSLKSLGKKKLIINNVLMLELNNRGMLVKKEFLDKKMMNKVNFSKNETGSQLTKNSKIYKFIKSLRNKVNDPLGTKR